MVKKVLRSSQIVPPLRITPSTPLQNLVQIQWETGKSKSSISLQTSQNGKDRDGWIDGRDVMCGEIPSGPRAKGTADKDYQKKKIQEPYAERRKSGELVLSRSLLYYMCFCCFLSRNPKFTICGPCLHLKKALHFEWEVSGGASANENQNSKIGEFTPKGQMVPCSRMYKESLLNCKVVRHHALLVKSIHPLHPSGAGLYTTKKQAPHM